MKNKRSIERQVSSECTGKEITPKYECKWEIKGSRKQRIGKNNKNNNKFHLESDENDVESNFSLLQEVTKQFNSNQNSVSRRNKKTTKASKSLTLKTNKGFRSEVGANRNAEAPKTKMDRIEDELSTILVYPTIKDAYEKHEAKFSGLLVQLEAEIIAVEEEAKEKAIQLHKEANKPKGTMFGNFMSNIASYLGCGSRRGRESEGDKAPMKSFAELKSERMRMQAQVEEDRGDNKLKRVKLPNPVVRYSREDEDDDEVFD